MSLLKAIPRRPLDADDPNGYLESDRDFVLNNIEICVLYLEQATELPLRPDQAKALDFEDHLTMEYGDFSCCIPAEPPSR